MLLKSNKDANRLKIFLFLQVLNGEELRSEKLDGLANPIAEGVRGDAQLGEAERPLSDLETQAMTAAEQAHAAAAAAVKVCFEVPMAKSSGLVYDFRIEN